MCAEASCNQLRKPRANLQSQVHVHCPFSSLISAAVEVGLPVTDITKGTITTNNNKIVLLCERTQVNGQISFKKKGGGGGDALL